MIQLVKSTTLGFYLLVGTMFLTASLIHSFSACSYPEERTDISSPAQTKRGTHIVVRGIYPENANFSLVNDSNDAIFVGSEPTAQRGFSAVSYALFCKVNEASEQDFTPEAHTSLKREQLLVGGEILFQVSRLPKDATACRVVVRYFDSAAAVSLLDQAISENRFEKLTSDDLMFIESGKKDAEVTFNLRK